MNAYSRLGIAGQLIVPFVAISVLTTALLGLVYILAINNALSGSLNAKSQIISSGLANELAQPLEMGEYDHMESLLKKTLDLDPSISYAVVVAADGRVLASTDNTVKNIRLDRDPFERSALSAKTTYKRPTKYSNIFEIVSPILTASGEEEGILRAGFSNKTAQDAIEVSALEVAVIGALALVGGVAIYVLIIRKSIIQPVRNVAHLASRISESDLSTRADTGGQAKVTNLQEYPETIAANQRDTSTFAKVNDLRELSAVLNMQPNSDVFGQALESMVSSINKQSKEIRQLAAIVEYSEDAIYSISRDGRIINCNQSAQKLFGYSINEIVGSSVELILAPEDSAKFFSRVGQVFDEQNLESYDTVILRRDGSQVPVALSISPVKTEGDRIVAVAVIARDITHKKIIDERMRDFYSIVSHELRTPLTSIHGVLCLLAGGIVSSESEEGVELIETAKTSTDRLGRLINDMLDLRKIECSDLQLNTATVDAAELAASAVNAMRAMAEERSISLITECPQKQAVVADSDRIIQVLTNLISNAIKYSNAGSNVYITVAPNLKNGQIKYSVKDHGPGIAEELQHKLFQKFQQIDASDSRDKEGTGLGLAISKAIVEQHGGNIGVKSAPGLGSTFWFELPLESAQAEDKLNGEKCGSLC